MIFSNKVQFSFHHFVRTSVNVSKVAYKLLWSYSC